MRTVWLRNSILHRIYMAGYAGRVMPNAVRRVIAGTPIHRAWFLGYSGHFEERGTRYGLANPYRDGCNMEYAE